MNLFTLDHASRRGWRLGKANLVRIYYLGYAGTAAYRKLRNLGSRSGAAAAFSGEPPKGALIEHAGANKTTMARISLGLEGLEGDQEPLEAEAERLRANFKRRGEELRQALRKGRQWFGVEDKLPGLMQEIRAFLARERERGTLPPVVRADGESAPSVLSLPSLLDTAPAAEETDGILPAAALPLPVAGTVPEPDDLDSAAATHANGSVPISDGRGTTAAAGENGRARWLALSDLARKEREEKARAKRERANARTRRKEQPPEGEAGAATSRREAPAVALF